MPPPAIDIKARSERQGGFRRSPFGTSRKRWTGERRSAYQGNSDVRVSRRDYRL
jgi:hypothetical protein